MSGTLFLVSTPIGNLADVSERSLATLRDADVCFAEDTRLTGRMLGRLGIEVPLRSLHSHNEASRVREILARLDSGETCVIVSDAGTPAISDPGRRVVEAVHDAGHTVAPIPGPSAVTAALAAAGLPADRFLFLGFAPRRGGARGRWLRQVAKSPFTVVVFESPRRLGRLLNQLEEAGLGTRRCVVCRELTKLHEEVSRGRVSELARRYAAGAVRGEVTLVLEGAASEAVDEGEASAAEATACALVRAGHRPRDIAARLREAHGLGRNDAYRLALRVSRQPATEHGAAGRKENRTERAAPEAEDEEA